MKRSLVLVGVGLALIALYAAPAGSTPPEPVTIEVDTQLPPDAAPFGPFTATAPVCASGDTVDTLVAGGGFASGRLGNLLVVKHFTCEDGSGTFLLLLQVHLVFDPFSDTGTWTVLGGTGAYTKLHGRGELVGVPTDTGVFDTFTGTMHVD